MWNAVEWQDVSDLSVKKAYKHVCHELLSCDSSPCVRAANKHETRSST